MMVVCDQVIREIQQNQQSPYNFEGVAIIQKLLESPKLLSTEEAYKKSLGTFSFLLILLMSSPSLSLFPTHNYRLYGLYCMMPTDIVPRGAKALTPKQIKECRARYKKLAKEGKIFKREEVPIPFFRTLLSFFMLPSAESVHLG